MGIISVWGYAWSCLSAYMALGIAWYLLDRSYGHYLYRWLYDLFHNEPMPLDQKRGVMFNQPTNRKVTVAFVISTMQSLYMLWHTEVNLLVELIMWLLEVPAMLVGFAMGSWVHRFLVKRSILFDRLDEFGEKVASTDATELRKAVEGNVRSIGDRITSIPATMVERMWNIIYPPPAPKPAGESESQHTIEPIVETSPEVDRAREAFDRYTRRS